MLFKLFVLSQACNGFSSVLFTFLINISSFLILFTVIPIDFLLFSHFVLAFCS